MKNGASIDMYFDPSVVLNNKYSILSLNNVISVVKIIPINRERVIDSIILFFNDLMFLFLYNLDISGMSD